MSNNTLMMAIIATLHPVPATGTGIVPVGSKATAQNMVFGVGVTSMTAMCALPAGSAAGDTAVLSCNAQNVASFAWAPRVGATVVQASASLGGNGAYAVYAYRLSQADVDAGSVGIPCSITGGGNNTVGTSVVVDGYRSVAAAPIDVVGTAAAGTFSTSPQTITAPGITTTQDGAMLQYAAFAATGSRYASQTPPAGWTVGDVPNPVLQTPVATGYLPQATQGATGNVGVSVTATFGALIGPYAILLLSMRRHDPVFRITGTLAAGTVGTPYTGTLTLAGDFVAPVTITGLPAWMTYTIGGNTVTLGGTPTTAQTYTFTPVATDANSQVATGAEQTVVVSAASADITPVQVIGLKGDGSKSVTWDASKGWVAPKPGNLLIAMGIASSSGATKPAGFTDLLTTGASQRAVLVWYKVATGSESSVTMGAFAGQLMEISGAAIPSATNGAQYNYASSKTYVMGPLTPPVASCLAIGCAAWNISSQTGFTTDAGWALEVEGEGATFSSALAYKLLDASLAPVQVAITANSSVAGGASFLLVKPA